MGGGDLVVLLGFGSGVPLLFLPFEFIPSDNPALGFLVPYEAHVDRFDDLPALGEQP